MWARPEVLIVGRSSHTTGQGDLRYRAMAAGGLGVLAGEAGERVVFEVCAAESLIGRVLAELPELGPVPCEARPMADDVVDPMREFLSWPIERFGSFELSVRGQDGQLTDRGGVQFFDTAEGRFMVTTTVRPDGSRQRTFVPADGSDIERWLSDQTTEALAR